eukprot:2926831-Prymnesium_polylepis.2
MRCTNTTIGTSRMPVSSLACSSRATRKVSCLSIHVLPAPGPATTRHGCAWCVPYVRSGDGSTSTLTSALTLSSRFQSDRAFSPDFSKTSISTYWSSMRSERCVIASSTYSFSSRSSAHQLCRSSS